MDKISVANRVSWKPEGHQRRFGHVQTIRHFPHAEYYIVREDNTGLRHVLYPWELTRECA